MRIAMLNPQGNFDHNDSYLTQHPDFGGQLVYVKEVALALAGLGHQVDILTRRIVDEDWPEFAGESDAYDGCNGVRIARIPCGPPGFLPKEQLWPYLGTDWLAGIMGYYKRKGALPDVFCAHYADGGVVGALLQQKTAIPFTLTAHSLGAQKMDKLQVSPDNLAELDARFLFRRRIAAERVSMNHAACMITSTQQEWREQYAHRAYAGAVDVQGADAGRCFVIPPGANRRIFSSEPSEVDERIQTRIRQALARDLPEARRSLPLVICSSRLDPKKNVVGLVRAFVENPALAAHANLAIVVRGLDDPFRQRQQLNPDERAILDEVAALLDEGQLWHAVTAFPLNNQAELAAAYRTAATTKSVFALTALYEPFGLAPLEAMSCGLPVVVTRNGGPAESLHDAATQQSFGVLVDPADPNDIARGLLKLLLDEARWKTYQRAGMARVIDRYTWESTAKRYLEAFAFCLDQRPQPRALLDIPPYFSAPTPENDLSLEYLSEHYFGQSETQIGSRQ